MKNKILIIEKDDNKATYIERFIANIDASIDVHGPLKSVEEVVTELAGHNDYDMIISSIHLLNGDVFDAFKEAPPLSCVIFTCDTTVLNDIKKNILNYLANTINNEFQRIQNKSITEYTIQQEYLEKKILNTPPESTFFNSRNKYRERFLINKGEDMVMLNVDDINYISTEDNHVSAYTDKNMSLPLSTTMSVLEHELDPNKFFRLNRKYIASVKGIRRITLYFCSRLKICLKGCNDDHIIISKEKATLLKKWLDY